MAVVGKSTVRVAGARQLIHEGGMYDERDPVVVARPELFESPEEHQRRKAKPTNTAELGRRSMSARNLAAPVESATANPGEPRDITYSCPADGCDFVGTSERAVKTHHTKAHS